MAAMGTVVSIEVDAPPTEVSQAFEWFRLVEATCSRFDEASELRRLPVGIPTQASPVLFEAVRFALQVAQQTEGAFDPTLGSRLAARGYNRHYLTRAVTEAPGTDEASFRDVEIDAERQTILLKRPLTLDLGAVAKGLAIDAAALQLRAFGDFCIDAGGDVYCGGRNPRGEPWCIGIRHPRQLDQLVARVCVSDRAVCTSGDYERGAHVIDPRDDGATIPSVSATVIAPNAILADALATAAFVLGPEAGVAMLERMGVDGLLVSTTLQFHRTKHFHHA